LLRKLELSIRNLVKGPEVVNANAAGLRNQKRKGSLRHIEEHDS